MPRQIALFIIIIIISFFLYFEEKRSERGSRVVWLITIWLISCTSKSLGFFLQKETSIEAGSPADRIFLLTLGILAIIIIIKRKLYIAPLLKNNIVPLIILFYMFISFTWSRSPEITFRRWGREAIALIMVGALLTEKNPIVTLYSAIKKTIYVSLPLSLVLIKYFPEYGRLYTRWSGALMWTGITSHKNSLAMFCAISIVFLTFAISNDISKKKSALGKDFSLLIDVIMVFLAVYLMIGPSRKLTYSATSFLVLIMGLISILIIRISSRKGFNFKNKVIIFCTIIMALGILMPFAGKIPFSAIPEMLNRSDDLTGRTEAWNFLVPYAKRRILIGHGFGGFWNTQLREQLTSHAHNGYLDTILDLGVIGLIPFVVFFLQVIQRSLRFIDINRDFSYFFLSLCIMIIIRNISESPLSEFAYFPMTILLFWSYLICEPIDALFKSNN